MNLEERINAVLDRLEQRLNGLQVAGRQIAVNAISEINHHLGLFRSGELRFGNSSEPGKGFTGVRIAYPPFTYGSAQFIIAGFYQDSIRWGMNVGGNLLLPHGSMWADDAAIAISIPAIHTHYPVTSGLTTGTCYGFTFQNGSELLCTIPGIYSAHHSLSLSNNASDQTIEGLIMINSDGQENTINATRAKENGVVYSVSGHGIITVSVGDIVRVALEKENGVASTITVNHVNLTLHKIG